MIYRRQIMNFLVLQIYLTIRYINSCHQSFYLHLQL
nr:MAG TPA: hypothetical protein [Caudoviricetes sp.]